MKAISLWQPWASLMQTGAKQFDTRGWKTPYRGPLVICSTKYKPSQKVLRYFLMQRSFQHGLAPLIDGDRDTGLLKNWPGVEIEDLPRGKALCMVNLVDVIPTEDVPGYWIADEKEFGDYSDGRYAWRTKNLRAFEEPFDVTGSQGFFHLEDELIEAANPQSVTQTPGIPS